MKKYFMNPGKLDERQFRKGWYICLYLSLAIPPISGISLFSFLGLYRFPESLNMLREFTGIVVLAYFLIGHLFSRRFLAYVIDRAEHAPEELNANRYFVHFSWIYFTFIFVYYLIGATSAHLSMIVFHGYPATLDFFIEGFIAVVPGVLITVLPIFFMQADLMGAYLAPRGVKVMVAPLWLKLSVLGLFTPLLIDTILIVYYYDRTGFFSLETLILWFALLLFAAIGTLVALRSFHQGMQSFQQVVYGPDAQIKSYMAMEPLTLDEQGRIAYEWSKLVSELEESRERYQLAVEGSEDGIWDWNIVTNEDYFSPRWLELLGYDESDNVAGRYETFVEFLHPDDKGKALQAINDHLEHDVPYHIEVRLRRKDGSYGWYLARGKATRDAAGNPVRMAGSIGDITVRKEQAEAMARLSRLIESGSDFIGYASLESVPIYLNRAGREMVGIDEEADITQYSIPGFFPESEKQRITNEVLPHVMEHGQWSGETQFRHFTTGELIPVYYHHFCIMDQDGLRPAFYGTVTKDLRPLKQIEERLQSERLFSDTVLDSANAIIVVLDTQGCITRFNKAAEKLTHYDASEVVGRKVWDLLLRPEDIEPVQQVFNELAIDMIDGVHTNYWVARGGGEHLVEWNNSVIKDGAGELKYVVSVGIDITEQEAAMRTIRNQSMIIDQIHDSVVSTDLDGFVTSWNKGAERIFGYSADEINGQHISVVYPEDKRDFLLEKVISPLKEKGEHQVEVTMARKNGEPFFGNLSLSMQYDEAGKVIGMIGYTMDVTDRKRAQEELEIYKNRLEKMVEERTRELKNTQEELIRKERLATLGQLTATVSHELRNPLAAMTPALYIISKHAAGKSDRIQRAVERIQRSIGRCDTIIDELLDFTRIGELDLGRFNLSEWLSSVLEEADIPDDIKLVRHNDGSDSEAIMDGSRMRRAFNNVLENAIQSFSESGETGKAAEDKRIDISMNRAGDHIDIVISDNGPGVAEDIREAIFEPLFSTKTFGVGLGMPTVRQIMRQHGGDVELVVSEGGGSTFRLWMPSNISEEKAMMEPGR